MHDIHYYAAAVTTYIVAIYGIFFNTVVENGGALVSLLGFILLIARLIQELPKAYRVIFKKDTKDDSD